MCDGKQKEQTLLFKRTLELWRYYRRDGKYRIIKKKIGLTQKKEVKQLVKIIITIEFTKKVKYPSAARG